MVLFPWWLAKAVIVDSGITSPGESLTPQSDGVSIAAPGRRPITPLILFFIVLSVVGFVVFNAVDGFITSNVVDGRMSQLQEEIGDLEWRAEQLSALVAFLDSDEYIERTAREELGLVRPGEEAIAIEAPIQPGLIIIRAPWWANLLPADAQYDQ